ncbi:MAG: LCP family protein [Clostridia bacterium]|nr:LCP family protein [Clostridia bacterium]
MNIKKFFITFLISTATLMLLIAVVLGISFSHKFTESIGGGADIEELDKVLPDGRRNVVVFGTDKSGRLADVIMIFSVSAKNEEINLISVPRDTKVKVPGYGTYKITETLSFGGDPGIIVSEVKEATGIAIHDYVVVNFKAVEETINALGGVEFNVPQNMYYSDPEQGLYINLRKGYQTLDGDKALQLLRFRSYPMGDIRRTEVQREFMKALFEQKATVKNFNKIDDLYKVVESNITSSMSYGEIVSYANTIRKMKESTFNTFDMPYILADPYVLIDSEKATSIVEQYFQ